MSQRIPRESLLRGAAVVVITGAITLAAACSDEDLVDTIPPPRPNVPTSTDGPQVSLPTSPSTPGPATTTGP